MASADGGPRELFTLSVLALALGIARLPPAAPMRFGGLMAMGYTGRVVSIQHRQPTSCGKRPFRTKDFSTQDHPRGPERHGLPGERVLETEGLSMRHDGFVLVALPRMGQRMRCDMPLDLHRPGPAYGAPAFRSRPGGKWWSP